MKKNFKIIFTMILFLPFFASAKCNSSELDFEKKLAQNINWTYKYYLKNNSIYFDLTIANVFEDLYIKDLLHGLIYKKAEFAITGLSDNQELKFEVYSEKCEELIITKNISLPAYNRYHGSEYCKDISDFSLCKRWGIIDSSITEETLKIETNKYRESLMKTRMNETQKYATKIKDFYIFIGLIIFILIVHLFSIFFNKYKKN